MVENIRFKDQHTIYKQIHPPSGVTHCCQAHFTHVAKDAHTLPNLVVVRAMLLQIYLAEVPKSDVARPESCHLVLAREYHLAGQVEGLAALQSRAPGVERDALLLTFRDAKLVVLHWDELTGGISTGSLHSWEQDATALKGTLGLYPIGPKVFTDPQGRCAAVLVYQNSLALLQSTGADSLEAGQEGGGLSRNCSVAGSYLVNLQKLGIKDVRDAAFLHRYSEPVLLLLHEDEPTWAGMYTQKKDTMCLTALSLNVGHQKHLKLWHAEKLPSDAHTLLPVPLGGVLVLCQTLILYHSQGVSCTVAVNSKAYAGVVPPYMHLDPMREAPSVTAARHAARFATNVDPEAAAAASKGAPRAEGLEVDLVDSTGAWLTPSSLLLALAEGQLLLVTLEVTAGAVRRIRVQKANKAPNASCCCRLGPSWVFLGSWVDDSILLHVEPDGAKKRGFPRLEAPNNATLALPAPKAPGPPSETLKQEPKVPGGFEEEDDEDFSMVEAEAAEQPAAKKRKVERLKGRAPVQETADDDEFSSLFSAIETARISTLATGASNFNFKAVDSLQGLGPIKCAMMADVPAQAAWPGPPPHILPQQLLTCSGFGRSGALAVVRRKILPDAVTEVPLAGVRGVWAVRFRPEGLPWEPDFAYHAFLLLTVGRKTKVLQTGEELSEMRSSQVDFEVEKPTLLAANLLSWARTVQVCSDKVVLLAGSSKQAETSVSQLIAPPEAPTGVQGERAAEAALPDNLAGVEILAACAADPYVLLHMSNGSAAILVGSLESGRLEVVQAARAVLHEIPAADPAAHITCCTLYQDSTSWLSSASGTPASTYCITCNASGLLQVFALPGMELVFDHAPVTEGLETLSGHPDPQGEVPGESADEGAGGADGFSARPVAVEVRMDCFARSSVVAEDDESEQGTADERMPCERPVLLMLLSDGGMLAYQGFTSPVGLRFARLSLDWTGHSDGRGAHGISSRMTRFDGLGAGKFTYSGVFIAGDRPLWLIASRGGLVPHPMEATPSVTSMTPFNNMNCPQGFITATMQGKDGSLKIAQLPAEVRLDAPWPIQRIPLHATPHRITAVAEHNLYAVIATKEAPYRKRLPEEEGGDTHATYAYVAAEAAAKEAGVEPIGEVRLLRAGKLSTAWYCDLMPAESPITLEYLTLTNSHLQQPQRLLAVGTAQQYGEDYPCTGRLLLFSIETQEGQGVEQDSVSVRLLFQREFQGPVMALAVVEGLLVVGWGNRLESHRWTGAKLTMTAFHEEKYMLITSISVIKRFVLVGDIHKGVTFLQMAEKANSFTELSKDFDNCDVMATDFVLIGKKLSILVADAAKNLRLFAYDPNPNNEESWGGKRLLPMGVFHAGHDVGGVVAVRLRPLGVTSNPKGVLTANLDGSLAFVSPLWLEDMVPPLRSLQRLLELKVSQPGGLNPRSYRERFRRIPKSLGGGEHWGPPLPSRTIIDGDLLWQYQFLPHSQQAALAQTLGFEKVQMLALLDSLADAFEFL